MALLSLHSIQKMTSGHKYTVKLGNVLNTVGMVRYFRDVLGRRTTIPYADMKAELLLDQAEIEWTSVKKDGFKAWQVLSESDGDVTFDIYDFNIDFRGWIFESLGMTNPCSETTLWNYITTVQDVLQDEWRDTLEFKLKRKDAPSSPLDTLRNAICGVFEKQPDADMELKPVSTPKIMNPKDHLTPAPSPELTHHDHTCADFSPTYSARSRLAPSPSPSIEEDMPSSPVDVTSVTLGGVSPSSNFSGISECKW